MHQCRAGDAVQHAPRFAGRVGAQIGRRSLWTVETERGDTVFTLKAEEDIRRLKNGALLIGSGEGVQYGIADITSLDRTSRRLLERFL